MHVYTLFMGNKDQIYDGSKFDAIHNGYKVDEMGIQRN
jgi:hypothetical protein